MVGAGELQEILPLYPSSITCEHLKKDKILLKHFLPQKNCIFQVVVLITMGVIALGCRNCAIKTSFSLILMYLTMCLVGVHRKKTYLAAVPHPMS